VTLDRPLAPTESFITDAFLTIEALTELFPTGKRLQVRLSFVAARWPDAIALARDLREATGESVTVRPGEPAWAVTVTLWPVGAALPLVRLCEDHFAALAAERPGCRFIGWREVLEGPRPRP